MSYVHSYKCKATQLFQERAGSVDVSEFTLFVTPAFIEAFPHLLDGIEWIDSYERDSNVGINTLPIFNAIISEEDICRYATATEQEEYFTALSFNDDAMTPELMMSIDKMYDADKETYWDSIT